jgi:hypothetical protein
MGKDAVGWSPCNFLSAIDLRNEKSAGSGAYWGPQPNVCQVTSNVVDSGALDFVPLGGTHVVKP